jgi:hypothetical protein
MASLRYALKTSTDIKILIPEEDKTLCRICEQVCKNPNALAGHIGAKHSIKLEDYLIQYYMAGERPLCPVCSEPTRYLRGNYCFKKYCVQHANESRKSWSSEKGFGNNGFDHSWREGQTKENNESILKQSISITGKNNPSSLSEEDFNSAISTLKLNNIQLDLAYDSYSKKDMPVKASCATCNKIIYKKLSNLLKSPACPSCCSGKSKEEQSVFLFVEKLGYNPSRNFRDLGKELDIFIPEKNYAIEYNGLFWHTEDKVGKQYHSEKHTLCRENNISLFQIFSDEWRDKRKIIESMLKHRLGTSSNKVYARKCNLLETSINKTLEDFFDSTHISGHTLFKQAFYLEIDGIIVAALSLRRPFQSKYENYIEIARFSTARDTKVSGAFGKLLKAAVHWSKANGFKGILTYADLRFGEGDVYLKNGFKLIGSTKPDYWYTDGKNRFQRFKYRAQPNKPEKQVAEEHKVKKIYGCGSKIFTLEL